MRKNIIVGFSFFVFVLSGCSKSEEDKCKDKGWYWDASAKVCKEKTSDGEGPAATKGTAVGIAERETQESCKSKQGYVWNTESSQCKKIDYFMLIRPKDDDWQKVRVGLTKGNSVENRVEVQKEECVKVPGSYLSNIIVSVLGLWSVGWDVVCSGFAAVTNCELGIYEVVSDDDDGVSLQSVTLDAERTDCRLLERSSE